jgi:hypothetical protein
MRKPALVALTLASAMATSSVGLARPASLSQWLPKRVSLGHYTLPEGPQLTPSELALQVGARAKLLALRAITAPAHIWPFKKITEAIAHGEPFSGITPRSAAKVALEVAQEGGKGVVIGRLSPTYRDIWTVREAERSFAALVDQIVEAKRKDPRVDASLAFDPDSFGLHLRGAEPHEAEKIATDGMMRIARYAAQRGVPLELDSIGSDALPVSMRIAEKIVTEVKVPVRLALAARFEDSEPALQRWIGLAKQTGMKLGVRLVKGSYLEADNALTINTKRALIRRYKGIVKTALENTAHLDVAVATQNKTMWRYALRTAEALGADFSTQVIRGVQPALQEQMKQAGKISREYVSYGLDAPIFGLTEALETMKEKRKLRAQLGKDAEIY